MADTLIPRAQEGPRLLPKVGKHGLGICRELARASLNVIAGQRNPGLNNFRVNTGAELP